LKGRSQTEGEAWRRGRSALYHMDIYGVQHFVYHFRRMLDEIPRTCRRYQMYQKGRSKVARNLCTICRAVPRETLYKGRTYIMGQTTHLSKLGPHVSAGDRGVHKRVASLTRPRSNRFISSLLRAGQDWLRQAFHIRK
jgi:hypothetical protein